MRYASEFDFIGRGYSLVTLKVIYFMPSARHLVNEFMWQTLDQKPKYPRVGKFLDYWRREIDAVIKEVLLSDGGRFDDAKMMRVDEMFRLH